MDGGRVLRAGIWKVTGNPHQGTIVAGWVGRVCALLALAYPFIAEVGWGRRATLSDYILSFVIALFLWTGASSSIVSARVRRRLPSLRARTLARRTLTVAHDVPLAEAVRQAQEGQAGSIVVLDSSGEPQGVVNEAAVLATPMDRRPWLPVSAVARSLEPGITLPADLVRRAADPGDAAGARDRVPPPRERRRDLRRPRHRRRGPRLRRELRVIELTARWGSTARRP